jgi:hypothetical protein
VGGQRPLEVGQRLRRALQLGLQPPEVVGDGAVEGDGRPDDDRAAVVGGERVADPPAQCQVAEAGGELAHPGEGHHPAAVHGQRRRLQVRQLPEDGLGPLAPPRLQRGHGRAADGDGRVRRQPGAEGLQQLAAAALGAAQVPELRELDLPQVGLADLPAEGDGLVTSRSTSPKRPVMSARMARRASAA